MVGSIKVEGGAGPQLKRVYGSPKGTPMKTGNTLYFDFQATTRVDPRVFRTMVPYFLEEFGNAHSADHAIGWRSASAVNESASALASWLCVDPDEVVFTSGATEANNLAVLGLGRRAGDRRRVLCSAIEHKSILAAAVVLRQTLGFEVELIPVDRAGRVNIDDLLIRLKDDVLLVSIGVVNNEIGTIQDITALSEAVSSVGAILHCDAAQAPCALDLREIAERVDLLSLSAHKMYGPKGVGALVAKRWLHGKLEPLIYGGGQQRNLRSGTTPTPLCVGMASAATFLDGEVGRVEREATKRLRDRFLEGLQNAEWPIELNGPLLGRHPGNLNVSFTGFSAHDILSTLQPRLAASTGAACTSGTPEKSHVLMAIGLTDAQASSAIRFSVGRGTTQDDIDEAICCLADTLAQLSSAGLRETR